MAAYMVVDIGRIIDPAPYAQYIQEVAVMVRRHGGRYLARGGAIAPVCGNWAPERAILIEFDSMEHAQQCFCSPEYRAIAPLREGSTESRAFIIEGVPAEGEATCR